VYFTFRLVQFKVSRVVIRKHHDCEFKRPLAQSEVLWKTPRARVALEWTSSLWSPRSRFSVGCFSDGWLELEREWGGTEFLYSRCTCSVYCRCEHPENKHNKNWQWNKHTL